MFKKTNFIIFLIIIFIALALYLIIFSDAIQNKEQQADEIDSENNQADLLKQTEIEQLEDNYKEQAKLIFTNYLELMQGGNYTKDQISETKNQFLDLAVPTKFKDLHLSLVLAITKMESYLLDSNEADKQESQQLISQAKANYSWLTR